MQRMIKKVGKQVHSTTADIWSGPIHTDGGGRYIAWKTRTDGNDNHMMKHNDAGDDDDGDDGDDDDVRDDNMLMLHSGAQGKRQDKL